MNTNVFLYNHVCEETAHGIAGLAIYHEAAENTCLITDIVDYRVSVAVVEVHTHTLYIEGG